MKFSNVAELKNNIQLLTDFISKIKNITVETISFIITAKTVEYLGLKFKIFLLYKISNT